ncbi:DUF72 domain-containing protein [Mucilaginibacter hurinus]|uniref:DUF72 domain-containing protein n=1 Tax=Mucilaginibacter hurinus TaxID=2201324 RepID=A0A367GRM0_9SPHI|nr:DUF72 domain-containing protein [Mucilaginibacter hurinus]RCH56107.1 DUF72 domain-containing protein [Mucilaginibacter hurinus]
MKWHIGCSGFHYKGWKRKFYPENLAQAKWFEFYCEHFSTLELNVTFYRFPQLSFLKSWYDRCPANFRFSVKAPRAITHFKQFHNSADMLDSFYDTINNGLQAKLGPVLFQMPPRFHYTTDKLERIINNLNPAFNNVLELRHQSWWNPEVYKTLGKHNIAFCGQSHPELPDEVVQNTPVIYYRFHGVPLLYKSPYTTADLKKVITQVKANKKAKQGWFYFNNDIDVEAVYNAKEMIGLVSDHAQS